MKPSLRISCFIQAGLISFIHLVLFTPPLARAAPIPELMQYLEEEMSTLDNAIASSEANSTPAELKGNGEEQLYFMNFWLRIRPRIGFSVPGLVKVDIIPEAEILWQREIPGSWEVYNPPRN